MFEEKPAEHTKEDGEVVYRRLDVVVDGEGPHSSEPPRRASGQFRESRYAPTLKPILIGFALLLALVITLGYLSVRELNDVSTQVLDLEQQYENRLHLLMELRVAAVLLDNESRARAQMKSRGEFMPPFEIRLGNARAEMEKWARLLDRPPYSQLEKWTALRRDLGIFIESTNSLESYESDGFVKFRNVETHLRNLIGETRGEQNEIRSETRRLESKATRRIALLTLAALLTGAFVVGVTIWEVQRRFRQMRESLGAAQRERQFSTQMLEGMVSAVAAIDAHDRIRSANAAFFKIFPGATIGASVYDKFASAEALKMLEAATASAVAHATYRGRWVCGADTPECANRTFDVYSSPLALGGEQGQIITLVDVTEAAQAESVLRRTEALAAVGQAAAQVAHEIKNPLGSIRLGISMLRDMTKDVESLNTIDLVERGIDHLNKLTADVTQFSRRKQLTRSEVGLQELINASLDLVSDRIKEKETPVEKRFSEEPLRGLWDADQLRQVFVNLLANAFDASEKHSPVTIKTSRVTAREASASAGNGNRRLNKQGAYARIEIADQGVGMNDETRARIFEPFFTTKKRGTGLGLAIVKQIVEQHSGTIGVESRPGEGTRFTIDLPL
jgi:signal transduction histidine kinase